MQKLSLLLLIICCLPCKAMEDYKDPFLSNLSAQDALEKFASTGNRTAQELIDLKKRALNYYQKASDYPLILEDGLSSNIDLYQQMTSRLLVETFLGYLFKDPRPPLSDVVRLLGPNKSLRAADVRYLKSLALSAYLTSDAYAKIMSADLSGDYPENKIGRSNLLFDTFIQYLFRDPKPKLQDALLLIEAKDALTYEVLIVLKKQLLMAFPDVEFIYPILMTELISKNTYYRNLTRQLALQQLKLHVDQKLEHSPFTQVVFELCSTGIIVSAIPEIRAYFEAKLNSTLKKKKKRELNLQFLSRADYADMPLLIIFGEALLKYHPHAREQLLYACEQSEHLELRTLCRDLFSDLGPNLAPEIYKKLSIYRHYGFGTSEFYEKNRRQLEEFIFSKLEKELGEYFAVSSQIINSINSEFKEKNVKENSGTSWECPICFDAVSSKEIYKFTGCGHPVCEACLKEHVASKMKEYSLPILCTHVGCGLALGDRDFKAAGLSTDEQFKLHKNTIYKKISQIPGVLLCSSEHCPDAFIEHILNEKNLNTDEALPVVKSKKKATNMRMPEDYHRKCSTCDTLQCLQCGKAHQGLSCERALSIEEKNNKAEAKIRAGKNKKYKPCPRCKVIIEKHRGCSHMVCRACGHNFNWRVLK